MQRITHKNLFKFILVLLVVITMVKILLVGYDIDEQYAIASSYRLIKGDFPLLDMWEPHQTSSFLSALLMYPFLLITKSTTGIILYLRIVGISLHFLTAYVLYRFLITYKSNEYSLLICSLYFFSLPKLMFLPEFSNIQIWCLILMIICFLQYYRNILQKYAYIYLYAAGVFLSMEVLTYPSSILLFPACIFLIVHYNKNKNLFKELIFFLIPCFFHAFIFLAVLFTRMDFKTLLDMILVVARDGSHSFSLREKLSLNINSIFEIFIYFAIYTIISLIIYFLIKKKFSAHKKFLLFINIILVVIMCGQLIIWLTGDSYPNYPLVEYFILPMLVIIWVIVKRKKTSHIFSFFVILPLFSFLGIIVFTNHPILVSAPFLIPCVVGILSLPISLCAGQHKNSIIAKGVLCFWLLTLLFGKFYMIRVTGGVHYTIVDQISVFDSGPALGLMADSRTVNQYNSTKELFEQYIEEDANVFYVGHSNDIYLMKNVEICSPSTISTPTFDSKVTYYFDLHPEKAPKYIICEVDFYESWIISYIDQTCEPEPLAKNDFLIIYQTK